MPLSSGDFFKMRHLWVYAFIKVTILCCTLSDELFPYTDVEFYLVNNLCSSEFYELENKFKFISDYLPYLKKIIYFSISYQKKFELIYKD